MDALITLVLFVVGPIVALIVSCIVLIVGVCVTAAAGDQTEYHQSCEKEC